MVDAGVLGARIASSAVAPLVKKLFVKDQPGAGLVNRPVRISALVSFGREKRSVTPKDVEKVAAELVRRALKTAGPGEQPVTAEEATAVTHALGHSLASLGTLTIEDYEAVGLGTEEFARTLRSHAAVISYGLSGDGELFYEQLLHTSALHILNFFTQRSTYIARQQTAQSRQLARLVRAVDVLLGRLPSQSAEDAGFEARYAEHITGRYGTLTIYGLDTGTSEWSLDTAYLSLEATRERDGQDGGLQITAEQVLAQHDQVLLRGVAGSGKTTLVKWLAVTTASRTYDHGLTHLIGRVPFVLPMRRIVRPGTEFPIPGDFLKAVGCPVAGEQPAGWAERVLRAGRGVLLVDGIDEIAGDRRDAARRWLRELTRTFPGNLWLVTSRPSAVPERWLEAADFHELTLSPMARDDVATFVRRWHRAAGADEAEGMSLLQAVRTTSELNRLATNPLMCGIICALNRDRSGSLPHGRKELYEAALEMLLQRRDPERDVLYADDVRLQQEPRERLLQKLAHAMLEDGVSELPRGRAVAILEGALPAIPAERAAGDGEKIFGHLLHRTGLLREQAGLSVDFVHRTFQDYLAAKEIVARGRLRDLVDHAHQPEWEEVIRMAAAHARPEECGDFLERLLSAAPALRRPQVNHRRLMAAACLDHVTELDPSVRRLVHDAGARLRAQRAVNTELVQMYWQIGKLILARRQQEGWGTNVVGRLAADVKAAFPNQRGFSRTNLMYMQKMARTWPEPIVQQPVGQLPWGHITVLMDKLETRPDLDFYVTEAVRNGWSRDLLSRFIQQNLHLTQGSAATNFEVTLPEGSAALKDLAREPYRLDFLGLDKHHAEHELELEEAITANMVRFLTELGVGFAFMGRQYPVLIGGEEYRIDLLFYHAKLHRYFVFELKTKDVRPEHVGKLNFYVSVVDKMVRDEKRDDATIGFLIGTRHNKAAVQLALDASNNPLAVTNYSTLSAADRELVPTEEDLSRVVQNAIDAVQP
ncbi:PDDEXK nuclease domain-containing protein [Streptomyces sp. ActVer]|uniref:PDDEXK nuclease domain-containing protein n=1 Tax=Streptomyces sp. ActVer TaxID=3014558 RepID=UPI0022B40FC2|nr:PDDEXK nuclease domain-containing protein [Streptomyces sp. ActVer]MCZ4512378.1 PDDEXK nuclease domain-containing protein [Streptomyces sp. ActVer]